MEWGPGYIEVYDLDGGGQQQFIISYDEDYRRIGFSLGEYGAGDSYEYKVALWFDMSDKVEIQFLYREENNDPYAYIQDDEYDWGIAYLGKRDFDETPNVYFEQYGGDILYKEEWQKSASNTAVTLLSAADFIIREFLSGYDVDGVYALGFENFPIDE